MIPLTTAEERQQARETIAVVKRGLTPAHRSPMVHEIVEIALSALDALDERERSAGLSADAELRTSVRTTGDMAQQLLAGYRHQLSPPTIAILERSVKERQLVLSRKGTP